MLDVKSIYFSCDLELGDIFGLSRINNFKIYEESFNKWDDKLVLGGMKVSKKERLIVVNSEISSKMKNFIIAHSIAHYFLHVKNDEEFEVVEVLGDTTIGCSSSFESEANDLACKLMITKETLEREIINYKMLIAKSNLLNGLVTDNQIIKQISDKHLIPVSVLTYIMENN